VLISGGPIIKVVLI